MSSILQEPPLVHLVPLVFIFASVLVALPFFTLHVLTSPTTYLLTTKSIPERLSIARRKFFYFTWRIFSPMLDPGDEPHKAPLLRKAYGSVLEIGAGVGDNIKYYRRGKVERLILVEPNVNMHPSLRAKANSSGYFESDGSLLLLGCGAAASDERALSLAGIGPGSIDAIACIHVLCGIPGPAAAVEMYRRILKPDGLLVFYEHVRSEDVATAEWQRWYTRVIWPHVSDGCCLDRPTGDWIVRGLDGDRGVGKGATTSADLVDTNGNNTPAKRWREWTIEVPEKQPKHSTLPHVKGWAIKI